MGASVTVTPDLLSQTGNAIIGIGDTTHHNVEELVGAQQGDADTNVNWATTAAVTDCANGWEQALNVIGSRLAVAGDTMVVNASNYHATEASVATSFQAK